MGGRLADSVITPGASSSGAAVDRETVAIALAALVVVVGGAVVLLLAGRDLVAYAAVLGGPVVSGIVGVLLSRRVQATKAQSEDNARVLGEVKTATDGLLSRRLDNLDTQLADAAVQRGVNAADAADAASGRPESA